MIQQNEKIQTTLKKDDNRFIKWIDTLYSWILCDCIPIFLKEIFFFVHN